MTMKEQLLARVAEFEAIAVQDLGPEILAYLNEKLTQSTNSRGSVNKQVAQVIAISCLLIYSQETRLAATKAEKEKLINDIFDLMPPRVNT